MPAASHGTRSRLSGLISKLANPSQVFDPNSYPQVSTLQLQLDRAEREVARRPEAKDYQVGGGVGRKAMGGPLAVIMLRGLGMGVGG